MRGTLKPYHYRTLGQVASLGRHRGIAQLPGIRLRGFDGWVVARVYHLLQLPSLTRRSRVLADWITSGIFRRDIAELTALNAIGATEVSRSQSSSASWRVAATGARRGSASTSSKPARRTPSSLTGRAGA